MGYDDAMTGCTYYTLVLINTGLPRGYNVFMSPTPTRYPNLHRSFGVLVAFLVQSPLK